MSFAHAIFEERAQGRKLSRNGAFLQTVIMQVRNEFPDHAVVYRAQSRWSGAGRRKECQELTKILPVVGNRVRRGVLDRSEVFKVLGDRFVHSYLQATRAPQTV